MNVSLHPRSSLHFLVIQPSEILVRIPDEWWLNKANKRVVAIHKEQTEPIQTGH